MGSQENYYSDILSRYSVPDPPTEVLTHDQARRLYKMHMRPLKLTPEMKTDMIETMERAEKNSNWRERHEEVRILKDEFPELLAVEEEDNVTCREKCTVFGRYHCLDHVRVETNAANSEARNDSYVMLLTN